MSDFHDALRSRRKFLKLVGGGAVALPVVGLTGCSGGQDAPAPAQPAAEPEAAMPAPAAAPETSMEAAPMEAMPAEAPAAAAELPQLSEEDATAKSLGYIHDTSMVDGSQYPRHQASQQCSNCALYQGGADDEWAACSIFPGKAVKNTGWCNVYAPKMG